MPFATLDRVSGWGGLVRYNLGHAELGVTNWHAVGVAWAGISKNNVTRMVVRLEIIAKCGSPQPSTGRLRRHKGMENEEKRDQQSHRKPTQHQERTAPAALEILEDKD